jgi:succinate dehydrogenase flavin-adding protein (antitoxin of CptAB toxin-antitoxin module)
MRVQNLEDKAQFILNFFEDEKIEIDIEEFVLKLSSEDEDFFYWLLDAESPEEREEVDQLSKTQKDVFVIYLQKASKFQTYKTK